MVGRLFQNSNVTFSFRSQYIHSRCIQYSFKTCNFHSRFLCIQDAEYSFKMCNFHASVLFINYSDSEGVTTRACVSCIILLFKSFCFHYDITPLFSLDTLLVGVSCLWFYCIGVVVLITGNGFTIINSLSSGKVIPKPET